MGVEASPSARCLARDLVKLPFLLLGDKGDRKVGTTRPRSPSAVVSVYSFIALFLLLFVSEFSADRSEEEVNPLSPTQALREISI